MVAVRAVPPDNAGTMQKNTATKSMRRSLPALAQIVQLIPPGMVDSLAEGSRVKARRFRYEEQVFSLMLGQLSGAFSLNEICDAEEVHRKKLLRIRGMLPARRNTFSHANRTRDPAVAEALFWRMRKRLEGLSGRFMHPKPKGWLSRFRDRRIYAVDASVLPLTLKSIDWARHRRQKAAAKLHMRCDVASRLPAFACVTGVQIADCREMERLCRDLGVGDVAIFDRAYNDSAALWRLDARGVFFVVREKKRARYRAERSAPESGRPPNVLSDEVIFLTDPKTRKKYPGPLRRIRARVEVDGNRREMVFLTNNLEWSAATIAELYRARWQVELLFKELKQTLQLRDFYGENANAVAWQIWTALLVHLLLRFLAFCSKWQGSYTRFAGVAKAALWERVDLMELLKVYGTAPPPSETAWDAETPCLPGFERFCARSMGQQRV